MIREKTPLINDTKSKSEDLENSGKTTECGETEETTDHYNEEMF